MSVTVRLGTFHVSEGHVHVRAYMYFSLVRSCLFHIILLSFCPLISQILSHLYSRDVSSLSGVYVVNIFSELVICPLTVFMVLFVTKKISMLM